MSNTKYKIAQSNCWRGFSLLELLIVIFIFALVIMTSTAVFSGIFVTQKSVKNTQANIEEARTALELMAKTIRMSSKTGPESATGSDVIYLHNNSQGKCVSYRFKSKHLQEAKVDVPNSSEDCSLPGTYNSSDYKNLTSVEIESGKFFVTETNLVSANPVLGRAIITMKVNDANLETAVSFRDYKEIFP